MKRNRDPLSRALPNVWKGDAGIMCLVPFQLWLKGTTQFLETHLLGALAGVLTQLIRTALEAHPVKDGIEHWNNT